MSPIAAVSKETLREFSRRVVYGIARLEERPEPDPRYHFVFTLGELRLLLRALQDGAEALEEVVGESDL